MNNEKDKLNEVASKTLSTEQLVGILKTLGFDKQRIVTDIEINTKTAKPTHWGTQHYGYIVRANGFETFVSWREASSEAEAYDLCKQDPHQCWHLAAVELLRYSLSVDDKSGVRAVSHNEYCDWQRSKDVS